MSTLTDQRAGVQKICMHLHHAYRGLRLYPADHPSAIQTIDALAETVDAHLRRFGSLAVSVEEACLLYEDVEVYSFADSRDNLDRKSVV
jgi:methylaspartate ammonia-lyase